MIQAGEATNGRAAKGIRIAAFAIAALIIAILPVAVVSAAMSLLFFDSPGAFGSATTLVVGIIFLITALLFLSLALAVLALFRPRWSLIWWGGGLALPATLMNLWLYTRAA